VIFFVGKVIPITNEFDEQKSLVDFKAFSQVDLSGLVFVRRLNYLCSYMYIELIII
jgi:hypothetical protein